MRKMKRLLIVAAILSLAACHHTNFKNLTATVTPHNPSQIVNPFSPPTQTSPPPTESTPPTTTTVSNPPPPPATYDIQLTWTPPTQNTDGSPLTNLAGYRIFYGASPDALTNEIDYPNPAGNEYMISSVPQGTYYLAIAAYTTSNLQSALSTVISISFP